MILIGFYFFFIVKLKLVIRNFAIVCKIICLHLPSSHLKLYLYMQLFFCLRYFAPLENGDVTITSEVLKILTS